MKSLSILMAFGLFIVAQAQKECLLIAAKIPECATGCLASASDTVGCGATDFKCQCSPENSAAIIKAAVPCVVDACGALTGSKVQSVAAEVCKCAASAPGVTSIPPPATPAASKPATSNAPASTSNTEAPVTTSSRPASSTTALSTAMPPFPTTTVANSSLSSLSPSGTHRSSSRPFSPSGSSSSAPFTGGAARTVSPATALLVAMFAAMLML